MAKGDDIEAVEEFVRLVLDGKIDVVAVVGAPTKEQALLQAQEFSDLFDRLCDHAGVDQTHRATEIETWKKQ